MRFIKTSLALLAVSCLAPFASAGYPGTTLTSYFYNDPDLTTPVGTGTMFFEDVNPGDGTYSFSSFASLEFYFDLGEGLIFSEGDITSDTDGLNIVIIGDTFHFAGEPVGSLEGSAVDFINADDNLLAFGGSPSEEGGYLYAAMGETVPTYFGPYGTLSSVPEPACATLLMGAAAVATFGLRRRRVSKAA